MTVPFWLFVIAVIYGPLTRWAVLTVRDFEGYIEPGVEEWLATLHVPDDPQLREALYERRGSNGL